MAARFKYRDSDRTVEDVTRSASRASSSYDSFISRGVTLYKPKEGENRVRVCPRTWDDVELWGKMWAIEIFLHFDVGPDKAAYLCLDKMKGERCPVCEARRSAEDEEEAKALQPSKRMLSLVVDRSSDSAGPQAWSMAGGLYADISRRAIDREADSVISLDNPYEGYDVTFFREGTGLRTKYKQIDVARQPTALHKSSQKMDDWLSYALEHQLPDLLVYYPAEYIEKVLFGKTASRRSDDDDVGGSRRERDTGRVRPRPAQEDDEEDARPASRGRRAPVEDPEDEEGDYDDPAARGRRAPHGDDVKPARGRRPSVEDDAADDRAARRAGAANVGRDPPFDEDEDDGGSRSVRKGVAAGKGSRRAVEEEDLAGEVADEETPTDQARKKLAAMKARYKG